MSYRVTVYFNDADIASTKIDYPRAGLTVNRKYGDTAYSAEGFDGTTQFTAYPDDGCYFTKWYYRIGDEIYDETIPPRESTDNPFTYSGTEDIVIRAEGESEYVEPPEETWHIRDNDLGALEIGFDGVYDRPSISANYIYRYSVFFADKGKASVSISSPDGTCTCYITPTTDWDEIEGIPYDSIVSDTFAGTKQFDFDTESYTTYYVWVRNDSVYSLSCYLLVYLSAPSSVKKWSWYDSNGSADADETYASYLAVVNKEITTNFFHEVWNDLVKKVDDMLRANGLDWDTNYATYNNTLMPSYPYELTADMFNSLRNNLKFVYDSGIGRVYPGDDVLGSYFTTLAQSMNDAIDEL